MENFLILYSGEQKPPNNKRPKNHKPNPQPKKRNNPPSQAYTIHSRWVSWSKLKNKSQNCVGLDGDISICSNDDILMTRDKDSDSVKAFNETDKNNSNDE